VDGDDVLFVWSSSIAVVVVVVVAVVKSRLEFEDGDDVRGAAGK